MVKLAEKLIGKAFRTMTKEEAMLALDFIDAHFTWLYPDKPLLDTLLEATRIEKDLHDIQCLIMDPWNNVHHSRGQSMVHEYLSEALSKVLGLARTKNLHIAIVAHPKTPQKDREGNIPTPSLYDISDGAMWRNKADYGIVCHRPDMNRNLLEVYVQKIKQKWMGKLGMVSFDYDFRTGRFRGQREKEFLLPHDIPKPF